MPLSLERPVLRLISIIHLWDVVLSASDRYLELLPRTWYQMENKASAQEGTESRNKRPGFMMNS
jgi:hypothetical protein